MHERLQGTAIAFTTVALAVGLAACGSETLPQTPGTQQSTEAPATPSANAAPESTGAQPTEMTTASESGIAPNHELFQAIEATDIGGLSKAILPEISHPAFDRDHDLYAKTIVHTLDVVGAKLGQDSLAVKLVPYLVAQGYIEDIGSLELGNQRLVDHSPSSGGAKVLNKADGTLSTSSLEAVGPFQIDALPKPISSYAPDALPGNYTDSRRLEYFKLVTGLKELPPNLDKDATLNITMGTVIAIQQFQDAGFRLDRATIDKVATDYGTFADNNSASDLKARKARFYAAYEAAKSAILNVH